ncbi:glycosyltransferase [Echinimonas agarilytica]|uniref:Glycosyltransferase n=1 Tax=Echinimonas agarilytica TaxID=1215918 RepID=A0AA42B7F1_9GAMM|nr:glycosyltransferase [Echinimonas agarilytica]MCM2679541.1 glycosyltransferase [Echinimonas agarilytica]
MSVWVQVVQHLRPGGIETMALDLQRIENGDDDAYIISLEGDKQAALNAWPRLKACSDRLIFMNKKTGLSLLLLIRLRRLLKSLNANAVHTHHIGPLIYGGLAARLAGIKTVIHTEHDAWHLRDSKRRLLQQWIIARVNPMLVADADLVARDMQQSLGLNREQIRIIKNGVNTHQFVTGDKADARKCLKLPENVPLIGCAGRLELEKGHKVLLEAMAILDPKIHLVLAGDGSQRAALEQQAQAANISHRVHFLGAIETMPTFYQSLDLFCLPSFFEGLSLVILEAQACGIPAVVTHVGASHEALCPRTGKLVEPGSPFALAQALETEIGRTHQESPRHFVKQSGDLRATVRHYAALRNHCA